MQGEISAREWHCYLLGRAMASEDDAEPSFEQIHEAELEGAILPLGERHDVWVVEDRTKRAPVAGFAFPTRSCALAYWLGLGGNEQMEIRLLVNPKLEAELVLRDLEEIEGLTKHHRRPKLARIEGGLDGELRCGEVAPTSGGSSDSGPS